MGKKKAIGFEDIGKFPDQDKMAGTPHEIRRQLGKMDDLADAHLPDFACDMQEMRSKLAWKVHKDRGRGCMLITGQEYEYVALADLKNLKEKFHANHLDRLIGMVQAYNPKTEFIMAAVIASPEAEKAMAASGQSSKIIKNPQGMSVAVWTQEI